MPSLILTVMLLNCVTQTSPAYDFCPSQYSFAPQQRFDQPAPIEAMDFSVLLEALANEVQQAKTTATPVATNGNCINGQCYLSPQATSATKDETAITGFERAGACGNSFNPIGTPSPQPTHAEPIRSRTLLGGWLSRFRNRFGRR